MCLAGMEMGQALWMTPRSSLEPPASPARPQGPAAPLAPAPQSCWSLRTMAAPRTPRQMLRAPLDLAPRSCWSLGTMAIPRSPHQILRAPPALAPQCWWSLGTTATPRTPHQMLGTPSMLPAAPTPGCWRMVLGGRTPCPWGHASPRGPTGASAAAWPLGCQAALWWSWGPRLCRSRPPAAVLTAPQTTSRMKSGDEYPPSSTAPAQRPSPAPRTPRPRMGEHAWHRRGPSRMKLCAGGCGRWGMIRGPSRSSPGSCTCGGWRSW